MFHKIRNKVALASSYLLLRYIATPDVRERAQQGTILMTKISNLEGFVAKQGSGRVFGRVVVKKADVERMVNEICTSLQAFEEFLPASKSA